MAGKGLFRVAVEDLRPEASNRAIFFASVVWVSMDDKLRERRSTGVGLVRMDYG